MVLWAPVVVAGVAATVYVLLAPIGIPVLAASVPPVLAGRRLRHGRPFPAWMVLIGFVGIGVATLSAVVFLRGGPVWPWLVGGVWVVAALATGSEALQARRGVPATP